MNAVEIEEAVSKPVEEPFIAGEFPYAFLESFGNKTATIQRLRSVGKNSTKKTDIVEERVQALLQRNNIHIATCSMGGPDAVAGLLERLVLSSASSKDKANFALATDESNAHAEFLNSEEPPLAFEFREVADHFRYFLELAGISNDRHPRENAFDIRATGRLCRLYDEQLPKLRLTNGDPEQRVPNPKKKTRYLIVAVELAAVYHLANVNGKAVGSRLHTFLVRARIDLALANRFGGKTQSWEWLIVQLATVEEAVERIEDDSVGDSLFQVCTTRIYLRGA